MKTNTPHTNLLRVHAASCPSEEMETVLAPPSRTKNKASNHEETPPEKNQHRSRRRRRLRFNEQITVRAITHIFDFSEEEIADAWYKKAEYQRMRSDVILTVRKLVRGEYRGDTDDHCARGLEFKTPVGARRRKRNKLNALAGVLDEQDRQVEENYFNLEAMAYVYINCNIASRCEAARRGERDAEESARLSEGKESLTILLCQYTSKIQEKNNKRTLGRALRKLCRKK